MAPAYLLGKSLDGDSDSPYPRYDIEDVCWLSITDRRITLHSRKGQPVAKCDIASKMSIQKRRTMAPKKKEKTLKRKNIITLKLTDIELELLQESAEITGLSRSEYIRKLLLEKEIHHQIEVVADIDDLKKLVSEYGKIGSNLNQIAKYFNTGGSRSLAVENEIHQCIADLFQLRKEVLKLSGGKNGNRKTH